MLMTSAQVEELMDKLLELSGLDEELIERCSDLVRTGQYDAAVSQAFVLLEEQMRDALGVDKGAGVNLSEMAFAGKTPALGKRLDRSDSQVEGICSLFVGAFKAFRNPTAHSRVGHDLDEARAIIQLVNLLLMILAQTRRVPRPEVPEPVAKALGPGATGRLRDFLERLKSLGIWLERGKDWWPLKARVRQYQIPGHTSPMAYPVAIFYLQAKKAELLLNGGNLTRVVDLDLKALGSELVKAGFAQTTHRNTPVRLSLQDLNDQATFDRIYEIVEELVKKYGVR